MSRQLKLFIERVYVSGMLEKFADKKLYRRILRNYRWIINFFGFIQICSEKFFTDEVTRELMWDGVFAFYFTFGKLSILIFAKSVQSVLSKHFI